MSENTEIRIIGTEVQENNALVYADTKLQTLDRRVGKDNLYFDKELFEESLKDWENTPVIYQKDGIHPDDFAAVVTDPKKAAEAIGGKLVGRVHDPHIVLEGGARLMATLAINEDEAEISELWQTGRLFPSTAFTTHSDGDKITTPPVPNHVLLFPMQVDKVVPGDPGAFVNTRRVTKMDTKTEETNTVSHEETVAAKDEEIKSLNAELVELKNSLAELETVNARSRQQQAERNEHGILRSLWFNWGHRRVPYCIPGRKSVLMLPVLNLMNQKIGVRRKISGESSGFYHEKIVSKIEVFPARVEIRQSVSFGKNYAEIPSFATIYTTGKINRDDEIILPDGSVRAAVSVEWAVDGGGNFSHSVVKV